MRYWSLRYFLYPDSQIDFGGCTYSFIWLCVRQDQLGSRQKAISFFERDNSSNYLIPTCIEIPTDGTDEWEIDVKQLQIEKKVASWFIWGDLWVLLFCKICFKKCLTFYPEVTLICFWFLCRHRSTYCSLEVAKFLKPERVRLLWG